MTEQKTTDVKEKIELSKEAQGILDSIESLTVLDLSNLVSALEDKFGVVAAPVAVAGAAVAGGAGADGGAAVNSDGLAAVTGATVDSAVVAVWVAALKVIDCEYPLRRSPGSHVRSDLWRCCCSTFADHQAHDAT